MGNVRLGGDWLRRNITILSSGPRAWVMTAVLCAGARPGSVSAQNADSVRRMHLHPGIGVRAGIPQRISVAMGIVTGAEWQAGGAHPRSPDVAIFVEPGWSAGRATIGMTTGYGNFGSGIGIGATVLRTWHDSWVLPQNQTFAGAEVWLWPFFFIGPRVGLFHAIGGNGPSGWRITGDFGAGL